MAIELNAEKRQVFGKKVKTLRAEGFVPCEIYGPKHDNYSIQISDKELSAALHESGYTSLITVNITSENPVQVLVKDVQRSVLKNELVHVDFHAIDQDQSVTVNVPIVLIGESALQREGGVMMPGLNELVVEARIQDIPQSVEVDVSKITTFGDSILVGDLDLPESMTIHSSPDSMLVSIRPPRILSGETEEDELKTEFDPEAVELVDDE